ncbi:hypothetical protein B0H17DRAFT_1133790 [Mycena rosella]|uniref:Uncharacterized protein n=1 Tax=Mycena rosella TaxID=1033263 RepID=A0AAD7DHN0_MYCRO|nr:hypothetical protein B0H17DRAFT_1133790 [Mycena rosella]
MDILLRARAGSQALHPGGDLEAIILELKLRFKAPTRSTAGMFKTCIAEFSVSQTKGLDREFTFAFTTIDYTAVAVHLTALGRRGAWRSSGIGCIDIPRTWRHAPRTRLHPRKTAAIFGQAAQHVSEQEGARERAEADASRMTHPNGRTLLNPRRTTPYPRTYARRAQHTDTAATRINQGYD